MSVSGLAKPEFGQFTAIPILTQWDRESGKSPGLQSWPHNSQAHRCHWVAATETGHGEGEGLQTQKCPRAPGRALHAEVTQ